MRTLREKLYPIGVSAKMVGLSVPTLRLYEKEGLVIPLKTKTRRRFFSAVDLRIVRSVHEMIQRSGMNFEGIRRLLAMLPCWDMKPCCEGAHRTCKVPKISDRPCWMVEETICRLMEMDCRACPVYERAGDMNSLKEVVFAQKG